MAYAIRIWRFMEDERFCSCLGLWKGRRKNVGGKSYVLDLFIKKSGTVRIDGYKYTVRNYKVVKAEED